MELDVISNETINNNNNNTIEERNNNNNNNEEEQQKDLNLLSRCLSWLFPDFILTQQWQDLIDKFNISNLLFCYCLPFFYVFYPTWLMPAIFLKSLSFVIGCLYRLISRHHGHYNSTTRARTATAPTNNNNNNNINKRNNSRPSSPQPTTTATNSNLLDDDRNHLYFWLQRCSICLEQTYSLCLDTCRDQFCKDCFSRYIEETVKASWGLGVTRIKCPVCQDIISQSEWSKYVSKEIVEKYNQFNQPYRPFSRYCLDCEAQLIPCQSPKEQGVSRERRLENIQTSLECLIKKCNDNKEWQQQLEQLLKSFLLIRHQKGTTFRIGRVQDLYQSMIPTLSKLTTTTTTTSTLSKDDKNNNESSFYDQAAFISKQLVAMEIIPEAWKQTQFWHITHFPIETCKCGSKVCFQCGEKAHLGLSCISYLKSLLQQKNMDKDQLASIQWKLNNTRPCPNCSVLINRDEGCNRVDCLLCGHRFCWLCLSSWSQQLCGFYQCGQKQEEQGSENKNSQMQKAELGVPNMSLIESKRRQ